MDNGKVLSCLHILITMPQKALLVQVFVANFSNVMDMEDEEVPIILDSALR